MFFEEVKLRVGEFIDHPHIIKHSFRAAALLSIVIAGEMAKVSEERNLGVAALLTAASAGSLALGTTATLAGRAETS